MFNINIKSINTVIKSQHMLMHQRGKYSSVHQYTEEPLTLDWIMHVLALHYNSRYILTLNVFPWLEFQFRL